METSETFNIYQFSNYRELLESFYNDQKRLAGSRFSWRSFSKRAGFSSSNFIHLAINGKRNLGYESIQRIARVMKLTRRELLFFEALVYFTQAGSPEEKTEAYKKVLSFKEYRESRKISGDQYEYFSRWYYPVIREVVMLKSFVEEPRWIAERLGSLVTPQQAKEALELLLRLQLLRRDEEGKLVQSDPNLTTEEEVVQHAVRTFHHQMIELGRESLKKPGHEREISALTMSLSQDQFQHIKKLIKEFHREVQKYIANNGHEDPDGVYQLNFQLFNFVTPTGNEG